MAAMAALLSALVIGLVSDLAAQELVVSPVAIDKSTEVEKEATFHNRKVGVRRTGQVSGFFICQGDNKDIYYRHDSGRSLPEDIDWVAQCTGSQGRCSGS